MPLRPCLGCGRLTRNGSRCPDCERRQLAPKRRRQKAVRAAAVRAGDRIDKLTVYDRHGGRCGICGRPLPRDARAFELDHVVPLSLGGKHVYANVRPAHPLCNQRRGAR